MTQTSSASTSMSSTRKLIPCLYGLPLRDARTHKTHTHTWNWMADKTAHMNTTNISGLVWYQDNSFIYCLSDWQMTDGKSLLCTVESVVCCALIARGKRRCFSFSLFQIETLPGYYYYYHYFCFVFFWLTSGPSVPSPSVSLPCGLPSAEQAVALLHMLYVRRWKRNSTEKNLAKQIGKTKKQVTLRIIACRVNWAEFIKTMWRSLHLNKWRWWGWQSTLPDTRSPLNTERR